MKMDKILIIGAGYGQIPLIQKAKERGLHVVVASIPGDYPGLEVADEVWSCDIYDREKLLELCKENGIKAVT